MNHHEQGQIGGRLVIARGHGDSFCLIGETEFEGPGPGRRSTCRCAVGSLPGKWVVERAGDSSSRVTRDIYGHVLPAVDHAVVAEIDPGVSPVAHANA